MRSTRSVRRWVFGALALLALAAGGLTAIHQWDIARIRQRVAAESEIVQTAHGQVEYISWGEGAPVLVVHGAGGGYDQGRLLPRTFAAEDYRWISVSRFGYLRSPMPPDASPMAQAEAFSDLLDALGVERTAILAMSGGVPPALSFAERHPDRTSAVVLLSSAPFAPMTVETQELTYPAWVYQALFGSDIVFWGMIKAAPSLLDPLFDIDPDARTIMDATDRAFVDGLRATFLPVTDRADGLRNEGAALDPAARHDLTRIKAPSLVVHAKDDGINSFVVGTYLATSISGAELMVVPEGGHLLLGHIPAVRERVSAFLARHSAMTD